MPSSQGSTNESGDGAAQMDRAPKAAPEVSRLGWGQWYTLKELEAATKMFADENVIGEGGYGIVYHGVLEHGTQVGVKNLLNNMQHKKKHQQGSKMCLFVAGPDNMEYLKRIVEEMQKQGAAAGAIQPKEANDLGFGCIM
ncbi:putative serine/threonine-protein kinase [Hordeum vulgare]|nr:putative serine/threonine-protein kinase [Hordeum vulgare]